MELPRCACSCSVRSQEKRRLHGPVLLHRPTETAATIAGLPRRELPTVRRLAQARLRCRRSYASSVAAGDTPSTASPTFDLAEAASLRQALGDWESADTTRWSARLASRKSGQWSRSPVMAFQHGRNPTLEPSAAVRESAIMQPHAMPAWTRTRRQSRSSNGSIRIQPASSRCSGVDCGSTS